MRNARVHFISCMFTSVSFSLYSTLGNDHWSLEQALKMENTSPHERLLTASPLEGLQRSARKIIGNEA